ncbi:MAG: hypothetical protein ACWA5P_03260 [bacterium]
MSDNEYLISQSSFPNLYHNRFNEEEKNYLKLVLSFLHQYNRCIISLPPIELEKIQKLFNMLIITDEKYINERTIHLYIFLFWDKIIWDKNIIPNLQMENFFYEGQECSTSDKFQSNLLPYISNNCDLIYYNQENHTIELIEIKNVDLDDRAISQIQRYYRNTVNICETHNHQLKIINLKPTLIIKHNNTSYQKNKTTLLQYWLTFPTYFRELLQIYCFEYCKERETLKMIDLKPRLKSLIKESQN